MSKTLAASRRCCRAATSLALLIGLCDVAFAEVTISSAPTENMNCAGGVCAPLAKKAVLNVVDLENLLASGNVEITTTGAGVQANNIRLNASLTWTTSSALSFDAYRAIAIDQPISVSGLGGLSLRTNDSG